MLIAEAKKQGKAYGLYFEDISSGFGVTTRRSPQRFQVIPLVVVPGVRGWTTDELVRASASWATPSGGGAEQHCGDRRPAGRYQWNMRRGVGQHSVSAVAPAMLVSQIETHARRRDDRPPSASAGAQPAELRSEKGAN